MYSISNYVITYQENNGDIIICNTLSERPMVFKFDEKTGNEVLRRLNNRDFSLKDKVFDFLYENMFIVDDDMNQESYINYQYNRLTYGNRDLCMTIIPTECCNMKCVYCYENGENNIMSVDGWNAIEKFIKNNINKFANLHIAWFGGEPLICKMQILRFLKKIKAVCTHFKKGFRSEMITNGVLLDFDTFESLVDFGVLGYQITLDGFEEMHNSQRVTKDGSNGYRTIMSNLIKIHNECKKRFQIIIRVNFQLENKEEICKFTDYLYSVFGQDERFSINLQSIRDWGNDVSSKMNITSYEKSGELFDKVSDKMSIPISDIKEYKDVCAASYSNYYYINWDLSIYKCSLAVYNKCKYGCIGRIENNGKLLIDSKKEYVWSERGDIDEACLKCKYYGICFANGCPYKYLVGKQKKCQEFKFTIDRAVHQIANKIDYTHF